MVMWFALLLIAVLFEFKSFFCQYHGLGLLYHIKKQDRLAISKLLTKFTKQSLKSPYAMCMMVSKDESSFKDISGGFYLLFTEFCIS